MTTPPAPVVLFANLPWWSSEPDSQSNMRYLRRGVRAGSRWPFTVASPWPPDNFEFGQYLPYPMFLGSAAAWVRRVCPDATVIVRDSLARFESYKSFDEYWQRTVPSHVVLEVGAASWEHDLRYIRAMKRSHSAVRIAVAGPPARELSVKTEAGLVDAWLLGEYEKNAAKFVQGAAGVLPFDMLTREELAQAPFPMFDEDVWWHYCDANPKGTTFPEIQMWASRGCYWTCSFCAWPASMTSDDPEGKGGRKVRFYSPEWVESFIRHRMKIAADGGMPLKSVRFDDDTFNLSDRHVLAICEVMKRIGLPWSAMCRADTIKWETWAAMKASGCLGVKLGFESGSQRVVDDIVGKKLNLAEARATSHRLRHELGMSVHTTWTVGLPGEREDERAQTLTMIQDMYADGSHDSHQLSGTAVIPGTPLGVLGAKGSLEHFPGAKIEPGYNPSPDGQLKIETMVQRAPKT